VSEWVGGLAEWDDGDITYLSVAFTWLIPKARERAAIARSLGKRAIAGGPALMLPSMRSEMRGLAEMPTQVVTRERNGKHSVHVIGAPHPDGQVVHRHNPLATFATRGCDQDCSFCTVPTLEGRFTYFPDFPVRSILCDNNLSGLEPEYQDYIVRRYQETGTPLLDANSGFEPKSFNSAAYARWRKVLRGPWRFGYDETGERDQVLEVMRMLRKESPKRKRPYVLIGNEPFEDCMRRIQEALDHGCEPHVQWVMKLNALEKEPQVRFDWTAQKLRDVARWTNRRGWRKTPFSGYIPNYRTPEIYDGQQGLFV
jgi:hypothetical protein